MAKNITCGILIFLLALTILFIGFKESNDSSQAEDGLNIYSASLAIGPVDYINNTSMQVVDYEFVVSNLGNKEVYLGYVEPLFKKDFSPRILNEDRKIVVNQTIKPNSAINVKGQVEFNDSGLSKEQISNFTYIYSINIESTKSVPFP
jgi:hypothetical protein